MPKQKGFAKQTSENSDHESISRPSFVHDDSFWDAVVFACTTSISLGVYLQTVSPSISGGDSGELVAEGCSLGTSHPPGYPLYTLLVYIVTQIGKKIGHPDSAPAYFVNVMSCIFGALSSGLISSSAYLLSSRCGYGSRAKSKKYVSVPTESVICAISAMTAGLMHAFSPLAWQYSTTSEVFSLHNFFVAMIVHTTIRFALSKSISLISLGAFICGLALTNQHTSVLLEAPLILWIICVTEIHKMGWMLLKAIAAFFLGFSLYATLPLFAHLYPHPGSWGDLTSLSGFVNHFLRKDYGTLQLYSGDDKDSEGTLERTLFWIYDFGNQGNPITVFFFVYGCVVLCREAIKVSSEANKKRPQKKIKENESNKVRSMRISWRTEGIGRALVLSLILYLLVFHSLANLPLSNRLLFGVHQRFWMHPNILSFIFSGVGMSRIGCYTSKAPEKRSFAIAIYSLASITYSYHQHIYSSNHSTNLHFHNYAHGILDTLPKNALFFTNYDQQWTSVRYLQECEEVRNDVTSINLSMMSYPWWETKQKLYPHINFPGTHYTMGNTVQWKNGGFTFVEFLEKNYDAFPGGIFIGGNLNYPDEEYLNKFVEIPHGMTRKIVEKPGIRYSDIETFRMESLNVWKIIAKFHVNDLPDESKFPEQTWEWTIRREFFDHMVSRATHLLDIAVTLEGSSTPVLKSLVEAAAWLELAAVHDKHSVTPSLKKNLGLAYMHMVRNKELDEGSFLPHIDDIFAEAGNHLFTQTTQKNLWTKKKRKTHRSWKSWASERWSETWKDFLQMDGAKQDVSYEQIKQIYEQVMSTVQLKSRND